MPRSRAKFTQTNVSRALKGAATAGPRVAKVEIDTEDKSVLATEAVAPVMGSPLDNWRGNTL